MILATIAYKTSKVMPCPCHFKHFSNRCWIDLHQPNDKYREELIESLPTTSGARSIMRARSLLILRRECRCGSLDKQFTSYSVPMHSECHCKIISLKKRDNRSPYSYTLLTNSIILVAIFSTKRVISDPCLCYLKFIGIDFYPRGVGQSGRITNSSITTSSTKAATLRPGSTVHIFRYPDLFLSHARSTHFFGQVIEMSRGGSTNSSPRVSGRAINNIPITFLKMSY